MECQGITKTGQACRNKTKTGFYCHHHQSQKKVFEKPKECAICMETLKYVTEPLPCGHWVHHMDIIKSKRAQCPFCRAKVPVSERDKEMMKEVRDFGDRGRYVRSMTRDELIRDSLFQQHLDSLFGRTDQPHNGRVLLVGAFS